MIDVFMRAECSLGDIVLGLNSQRPGGYLLVQGLPILRITKGS